MEQPLVIAIQSSFGNYQLVRDIIDRGGDVNQPYADVSPMMLAADEGYINIVTLLLEHKDIRIDYQNSNGITALMIAAAQQIFGPGMAADEANRIAIMKLLLNNAKDRNINILEQTDRCGNSALIWATAHGRYNRVKLLLERGANVNLKNNNATTPLITAVTTSPPPINAPDDPKDTIALIDLLLKRGANLLDVGARLNREEMVVASPASEMMTALHWAVRSKNEPVTRRLILEYKRIHLKCDVSNKGQYDIDQIIESMRNACAELEDDEEDIMGQKVEDIEFFQSVIDSVERTELYDRRRRLAVAKFSNERLNEDSPLKFLITDLVQNILEKNLDPSACDRQGRKGEYGQWEETMKLLEREQSQGGEIAPAGSAAQGSDPEGSGMDGSEDTGNKRERRDDTGDQPLKKSRGGRKKQYTRKKKKNTGKKKKKKKKKRQKTRRRRR